MKARLVRIGNSLGIRIPKPLLQRTGLSGEVEITVRGSALLIRRASRPPSGWAEAFAAMAKRGDDRQVLGDLHAARRWDEETWEWR